MSALASAAVCIGNGEITVAADPLAPKLARSVETPSPANKASPAKKDRVSLLQLVRKAS